MLFLHQPTQDQKDPFAEKRQGKHFPPLKYDLIEPNRPYNQHRSIKTLRSRRACMKLHEAEQASICVSYLHNAKLRRY